MFLEFNQGRYSPDVVSRVLDEWIDAGCDPDSAPVRLHDLTYRPNAESIRYWSVIAFGLLGVETLEVIESEFESYVSYLGTL